MEAKKAIEKSETKIAWRITNNGSIQIIAENGKSFLMNGTPNDLQNYFDIEKTTDDWYPID